MNRSINLCITNLWFLKILFCLSLTWFSQVDLAGNYVIVVSAKTSKMQEWAEVVSALREKHSAEIIHYENSVNECLSTLRESFPRYACFVATPDETKKEFVKSIHALTRRLDDDPYTDLFWGILSGFDAKNALQIAKTSQPLIIRNSLASTEIALEHCERGKWFCELRKGYGMNKEKKGESQVIALPQDTTSRFVKELNNGKPDLFITSGHATEQNLQLGYRYRNGSFRCSEGTLFGADLSGQRHIVKSPNPKVYMPIGNCLMGHLQGPGSMAAAFFKSAGIRQMMGYVEVTWYGYMGWGCLDYFVEQPGRYTFNEAFFANHHALIHRLETCFPGSNALPSLGLTSNKPSPRAKKLGLGSQDVRGLLFDRDIVAFYGDPAWQAKMAKGKKNWKQELTQKGNEFRFSITPTAGPGSFSPVNENGVQRGFRPFIQFFDKRVKGVHVLSGSEYEPVITDTFILVPNHSFNKVAEKMVIVFKADSAKLP
jgi:zinc protease